MPRKNAYYEDGSYAGWFELDGNHLVFPIDLSGTVELRIYYVPSSDSFFLNRRNMYGGLDEYELLSLDDAVGKLARSFADEQVDFPDLPEEHQAAVTKIIAVNRIR